MKGVLVVVIAVVYLISFFVLRASHSFGEDYR